MGCKECCCKKMIHVCIRGRDVFVERDQFEAPEDAVFRAQFLAQHAGTEPHAEELSRIESCKRRYGTSYTSTVTRARAGAFLARAFDGADREAAGRVLKGGGLG
jgi:hypothetical protein